MESEIKVKIYCSDKHLLSIQMKNPGTKFKNLSFNNNYKNNFNIEN